MEAIYRLSDSSIFFDYKILLRLERDGWLPLDLFCQDEAVAARDIRKQSPNLEVDMASDLDFRRWEADSSERITSQHKIG